MLYAYQHRGSGLAPLAPDQPLGDAVWIDLFRPLDDQTAQVGALGVAIPTLEDMEEIEISSRIHRDGDTAFMTVVLPGDRPDGTLAVMPVAFILSSDRLVTVRHHAPRPFQTYPARAHMGLMPPDGPDAVFVSLLDEIVARLADISEASGRHLEDVANSVFNGSARLRTKLLQRYLRRTGREAELMAKVRHALMTVERVLSFYLLRLDEHGRGSTARLHAKAVLRDIRSLEVHADHLAARIVLLVDTTIGLINVQQNDTVRILSVVAALFLPPTLIASIYGMNFDHMPELHWRWGYLWALGLMAASAGATWLLARVKRWL